MEVAFSDNDNVDGYQQWYLSKSEKVNKLHKYNHLYLIKVKHKK